MPIQLLPASVISKIAAGEVVERPSSAVKEMLENSLDAQAQNITLELREGGRDFIRIVDDGVGIPADELPLAVASHATSKLTSADDLFRVQTLGFRGEAVASIAGVSEFRMLSRPKDQPTGAMIEVHHGEVQPVRECGCPFGTQVEVRNLFASVPVRRKFLKSKQTELGHVTEAVTRIALAFPHVGLKVIHNDRTVLERPAGLDRRTTIANLFGSQVADSLMPVELERDGYSVRGFAVAPDVDRPNSRCQYLFVNGRFIRDRSLGHAITEAYRGLIMTGRYPIVFLFVNMPADQVDVNVHPTKIEVRFQDPNRLYSLLLSALRTRFLASDLTPKLKAPRPSAAAEQSQARRDAINEQFSLSTGAEEAQADLFADDRRPLPPTEEPIAPIERTVMPSLPPVIAPSRPQKDDGIARPSETSLPDRTPFVAPPPIPSQVPTPPPPITDWNRSPLPTPGPVPTPTSTSAPSLVATSREPFNGQARTDGPVLRALQIHNSYLVVEVPDGMLLVDQHALHERILYERLRQQVARQGVEVQNLLVPEPVELSTLQVGLLMEQREVLAEMGLLVEEFGNQCVLLQGFPAILRKIRPEPLLREIAGHLEEAGKVPSSDQLLEDLLNMAACKAAVKAGDPLTDEEIRELLRERHLVDDSHHCPHGRPTILHFTLRELEKQFKRV